MTDTTKIAGVEIERLMRNLNDTSYQEGVMDLACRLSDCKAVIEELLAARATPVSPDQQRPGDFAKIVRGSCGQQVLFYKEDTDDQPNTLHHVVMVDGVFADMKLSGLPDGAFEAALDKCDTAQADKVIAQMKELGL